MKTPALKTSEHLEHSPILIVDKIGVIGEALAAEFSKDYFVVFVSAESRITSSKNILHIPFKRKIPQIPDNRYLKIFIIDDGEAITKKSSFSFISKAREYSAPLYFIASLRNTDASHTEEIISSYGKSKALILGDLFDKKIFFDKDLAIGRYILTARKNLKIDIVGNGLSLSFPITFSDTIKLIVKASYLEIAQKIILLFYPHPITDISLAHVFQKLNPNISVDFSRETKDKKNYIPAAAVHALSKYNLEEKIKELDLEGGENRGIEIIESKKKRKVIKPIALFFLIAVFLINLPLVTTSFYTFLATSEMGSAKKFAEKGEFENALKKARNSKVFFETANQTGQAVVLEARIIGRQKDGEKLMVKVESGKITSSAAIYFLEGGSLIKQIYDNGSKDPKGDFSKASNSFKSGIALIQKARAQDLLSKDLEEEIENLDPIISLFSNSSEILSDILGFEKEKTYLVLFQNNLKLRPGGGFIESFAVLKVKNGKAIDFSIKDVYQTDGQLKTHVEPPFAIRRYLPSEHYYLRDSNFDPDFIGSAISASNIYSLATKEKVDAVVGIDLFFAKNILSVLGEIKVSDYEKKVGVDNLFEIAQKDEGKKFLGALASSLEHDLKNKKNIPYLLLAQNVGKSIKEKHLTFAFVEQSAQNVFTANGWSASLWDNRKNGKEKINDYVGISEANLGGNSVNYFVSRSVSKKLIIYDDGRVSSKLTVAFKNNSTKEVQASNLGGNYKNYLQLILPEGSRITSILVDNKEVEIKDAVSDFLVYEKRGFRPPTGIEVEGRKEMGKSIFGFLISVGPSEIKSVMLSYELPYSVSTTTKSIDYSLKVYKQPGIDSYPMDLSFSIPFTYKIVGGKESYSKEIRTDENFIFNIVQN